VCLGLGRRIACLLDLDIWTYHLIKINNNKKRITMHILDLNFLDLSSNNRNNENENKKNG